MPIAALVMSRAKSPDLAARLLDGEVVTRDLEDRVAAVAVADYIASAPPRSGGSGGRGGSGSRPPELPMIELGITVPRAKA